MGECQRLQQDYSATLYILASPHLVNPFCLVYHSFLFIYPDIDPELEEELRWQEDMAKPTLRMHRWID
jgi:hypothetical protein